MTSRETAWKSRAPAGFEERVAQAMTRRMYLVQECGPTSFVVKEAEETQQNEEGGDAGMVLGTRSRRRQEQKKFKVQLGGRMSCSCRSKEELPCFHLLFVLLKLLRVPPENPFLWQDSLLDSEVEQILRGRFNVVQDRKKRESPAEASAEVEQKPIVEGDVCVICQEELSSEKEPLTYCRRSCGNSVHARCMKVWGEHKTSQKENISCPLCREDWGPDALALLSRDLRPPRRPSNLHHGVCCSRCRSLPVVGTRYRCLLCQDLDLCSSCFAHDSHRHHPFVQKELRDSPWAPANRQANRRGDGGEGRLQQQLMQQLQSRELTEDDYEVLLQLDSSSGLVSLHEHLVLSLPHPSRDQVAQAGERGSTSCVFCSHAINNGSELRRLTCSCLAHQLCLQSQLILDPSLCCPSCSLPLFPGLAPGGARDQSRTRRRRVSDKTSKAGQAQEEEAAELSFAVTGKCLSGGNVEMMASNQHAGMEGGGEGGGGGAAAAAASSSAAAALPPHPHGRSSLALTMQRLRKGTRSAPVLGGSTRTSSLEAREGGGSIVTHGRSLGRSNGGDEEALAYSSVATGSSSAVDRLAVRTRPAARGDARGRPAPSSPLAEGHVASGPLQELSGTTLSRARLQLGSQAGATPAGPQLPDISERGGRRRLEVRRRGGSEAAASRMGLTVNGREAEEEVAIAPKVLEKHLRRRGTRAFLRPLRPPTSVEYELTLS